MQAGFLLVGHHLVIADTTTGGVRPPVHAVSPEVNNHSVSVTGWLFPSWVKRAVTVGGQTPDGGTQFVHSRSSAMSSPVKMTSSVQNNEEKSSQIRTGRPV
jgi:hypothetical protein